MVRGRTRTVDVVGGDKRTNNTLNLPYLSSTAHAREAGLEKYEVTDTVYPRHFNLAILL